MAKATPASHANSLPSPTYQSATLYNLADHKPHTRRSLPVLRALPFRSGDLLVLGGSRCLGDQLPYCQMKGGRCE